MPALHGLSLQQAAHTLGISRTALIQHLRKQGVFFTAQPLPKPQYIQQGFFVVETKGFSNNHGINRQYAQAKVTGLGLSWLINEFSRKAA